MKPDHSLKQYQKSIYKPEYKGKIFKLLENNIGEYLPDLHNENYLLNMT